MESIRLQVKFVSVQHFQVLPQQSGVQAPRHLQSSGRGRKTPGVEVFEQCFRLVVQAPQHSPDHLAGSSGRRSLLGVKSLESTQNHQQFGGGEKMGGQEMEAQ